jgi:hypothetical protein
VVEAGDDTHRDAHQDEGHHDCTGDQATTLALLLGPLDLRRLLAGRRRLTS